MRDTIFISHATPEDNEVTIWLASKLELMGYKVWIDKKGLLGGEKIWEEIDNAIRNLTIKFLLIYSENIFIKDEHSRPIGGKLKDGVSKEYNFAESIGKKEKIKDFIIPLNIDDADYNLFIGLDRSNQISFSENWAKGLIQLEKKLVKNEIPKSGKETTEFGNWYQTEFLQYETITSKNELYYSNWWEIPKLPDYYYLYEFDKKEQATVVRKQKNPYPISQISNYLSSFNNYTEFTYQIEGIDYTVKPKKTYEIKITDVLIGFESSKFPSHRDTENHFKSLLKETFHQIMKQRRMFWYEMANKKLAYYYTTQNLTTKKVSFDFLFKNKNKVKPKKKNLIGKHLELGLWHYAVSVKPTLSPFLCYSLKNHICFTNDGLNVWQKEVKGKLETDKDKIHTHRRRKGKTFFNEEWRDLFLAFINGLKKDGQISINLSDDFTLKMPSYPIFYWADFGYYDPKDKTRQGLLNTYEDEIDETEND